MLYFLPKYVNTINITNVPTIVQIIQPTNAKIGPKRLITNNVINNAKNNFKYFLILQNNFNLNLYCKYTNNFLNNKKNRQIGNILSNFPNQILESNIFTLFI